MGIPYTQRVGEKHNMLTIIKITGKEEGRSSKRTKIRCLVKCDCGNEKDVRIEGVVNGQQYSCGCNRKKNKNSAESKAYTDYRGSARDRGYSFELTFDEFKRIATQSCHYCGSKDARTISVYRDTFKFNGIDRIDSSKGYIVDNCVPCCGTCNRAKNILSYEEFMAWIRRMVAWQQN